MKRLIITLALILVAVAGTLFYLDCRIPRATATLQVYPTALPTEEGRLYSGYMESSFDLILSPETMNLAADSLNISGQNRDTAINSMNQSVTAKSVRGTDFIEITAKNLDPKKAIMIANAVAQAAIQHRNDIQIIRADKFLTRADAEIAAQRELHQNNRSTLKNFLDEQGFPFPSDDSSFPNVEDISAKNLNAPNQIPLLHSTFTQALEAFQTSGKQLGFKENDRLRILPHLRPTQPPLAIHERATLTPSSVPKASP